MNELRWGVLCALLFGMGCGSDGTNVGELSRATSSPSCIGKMPGDLCESDGNVCTIQHCVQVGVDLVCTTFAYAPVGTACQSDGDPCTLDVCGSTQNNVPNSRCEHNFAAGLGCAADQCVMNATCQGTAASHSCIGTPLPDGTPCQDDRVACTIDECERGVCEHVVDPRVCNDGNVCSLDICDPVNPSHDGLGCIHPP